MQCKDIFIEVDLPQPFSEEELYVCFQKMNNGDLNARKEIIEHNIRLVINVVIKSFSNTPYDKNELVGVGLIGLVKSVDTFDINKKIKFTTYSVTCIKNEILLFLRKNNKHINVCSLEESLYDESDSDVIYKDILVDSGVDIVLDYENKEVYEIIRQLVSKLPLRYRKIIIMYFGFNDSPMTQTEISNILGLSQSYICRIINKVIKQLSLELQKLDVIEVSKTFYKKK